MAAATVDRVDFQVAIEGGAVDAELGCDVARGEVRVVLQGSGDLDLGGCQRSRSSGLISTLAQRFQSSARALAEPFGFEFAECGEDVEAQLAGRRGRVDGLMEGSEADVALLQCRDDVDPVA